jgi:hypothetical protein
MPVLRYAVQQLLKSPGLVANPGLALGIGANVALFGLVHLSAAAAVSGARSAGETRLHEPGKQPHSRAVGHFASGPVRLVLPSSTRNVNRSGHRLRAE